MSHFDWYSGSYRGDHRLVGDAVSRDMDAMLSRPISKGRHGFEKQACFAVPDGGSCAIQWGGRAHGDLVHVAFTGRAADHGARLLRQYAPSHRVSRVDVAEDVCGPGAYSALQRLSSRVARDFGVKRSRVVPDNPALGRTVYVGSRQSPVFVRIYEKGKQVLQEVERGAAGVDVETLGVDLHGHPIETWARCEVEVKPKAHARSELALLPPEGFWGCSEWSARLYRDLCGTDVARIQVGAVYQRDDLARVVRSMVTQYGNALRRLHQDLGSWECVGLQLRDELAALDNPKPFPKGH